MEHDVFAGCKRLCSIIIPSKLRECHHAFPGCPNLTTIRIEDGEEDIICGFENLQSLYYGREARGAGGAFPKLSTLAIGEKIKTVTKFGSALKTIYSYSRLPENIQAESEKEVYMYATLYVPTGTKEKYYNATGWKNFFNIQEMDINKMWDGTDDKGRTMNNPLSVKEACDLSGTLSKDQSSSLFYIRGRISSVDEINLAEGWATYTIEGDDEMRIQVYQGHCLLNADFIASDEICVNDIVLVNGILSKDKSGLPVIAPNSSFQFVGSAKILDTSSENNPISVKDAIKICRRIGDVEIGMDCCFKGQVDKVYGWTRPTGSNETLYYDLILKVGSTNLLLASVRSNPFARLQPFSFNSSTKLANIFSSAATPPHF